MALIYSNPIFLKHDTGAHPEHAGRLQAILDLFGKQQIKGCELITEWQARDESVITAVHDVNQVLSVKNLAAAGGGRVDADTVVNKDSYAAAKAAVDCGLEAVDAVLRGQDNKAFCLVRPPGHHATNHESMGFCLFNNVAVAARYAQQKHALQRVLIIDWDVHHGNGTQDIFYTDESVFYLSMHRFPFYPGTGDSQETGAGKGKGYTLNLPTRFGTARKTILANFAAVLSTAVEKCKPELILLSAGFDAHSADPIGSLGLEVEDFVEMTRLVKEAADVYASGRVISFLEGGYNPKVLAECVCSHISALHTTS